MKVSTFDRYSVKRILIRSRLSGKLGKSSTISFSFLVTAPSLALGADLSTFDGDLIIVNEIES